MQAPVGCVGVAAMSELPSGVTSAHDTGVANRSNQSSAKSTIGRMFAINTGALLFDGNPRARNYLSDTNSVYGITMVLYWFVKCEQRVHRWIFCNRCRERA